MPKTLEVSKHKRAGIDITWTKRSDCLRIGGWFDHFVGIESENFTLREFFDKLGITEKDCKKVWEGSVKNGNKHTKH